jgi:ribosome-associated heat shock protein Hsp15
MADSPADDKLRIDKWLWAARFYKTRSLAAEAVDAGKALVNGQRVKPAKTLRAGDELRIRAHGTEYTVKVLALSDRRGPAAQAALLYEETADSKRQREQAQLVRVPLEPAAVIRGRPTKKARRQLQKLRDEPF